MPQVECPDRLPCAILGGGAGTRLNINANDDAKPLVPLGGRPLIARVYDRIAPQCGQVIIISGHHRLAASLPGVPLRPDVIGQPGATLGPLAGVLTALEWAAEAVPGAGHVLTVPCDTPFLPGDLSARLAGAAGPDIIAVATSNSRVHHIVALWPVAQATALRAAIQTDGLRAIKHWLARSPHRQVGFGGPAAGPDPFFNVNTPADLARAEGWLS